MLITKCSSAGVSNFAGDLSYIQHRLDLLYNCLICLLMLAPGGGLLVASRTAPVAFVIYASGLHAADPGIPDACTI